MDAAKLREYRKGLYKDLFSNTIPDRIPIQDSLSTEFLIQFAGKDLAVAQYEYTKELVTEIYENAINNLMRGDILGAGFARNAIGLMLEGSIGNQMSETGMIQHPEISYMSADEYDEFIANPYDFIIEKISPRTSKQFAKDGAFRSRALYAKMLAAADQNAIFGSVTAELAVKYGFHSEPAGSGGNGQPPFDYIADFARGFSQIPMDMRRCPEKLHAAMDALMPLSILQAEAPKPDLLGSSKVMTHMGGFLSNKQFEEFYFPHFNEICHINAEKNIYMQMFLEQDWTRFIDLLCDMPMGTRFYMEYGDMKKFKDKMGKKFVLGGFYPMVLLRTGTKEQCIDKAKELLDIMAPGGNYYFNWDKNALHIDDVNVENYIAVMEYVRENGKYTNAGEQVSSMKREATIHRGYAKKYPEFTSKYYLTFDEYKKEYPPATPRVEAAMREAYNKYISKTLFLTSC